MDPDDPFWTRAGEVPDEFKLALGELVVNCARLEIVLGRLICWAAHVDNIHLARLFTGRLQARPKLELADATLQELADSAPHKEFKKHEKAIEEIGAFRNAAVHGWWMSLGEFVGVMSPKPKGKKQVPWAEMEGEHFDLETVQKHATNAKAVYEELQKMVNQPAPPLREFDGKLPC